MNDDATPGAGARCIGLLLAGGLGSRFRASFPANAAPETYDKLLARLPDGRHVVAVAAGALRAAVGEVVAVTPVNSPHLRDVLEAAGCHVVEAAKTAQGMGASIAAGARDLLTRRTAGDAASCMLALGDMPWVQASTLARLRELAGHHAIVAPTWQGQRGHPVTFARHLWPALAQLDGDTGARAVVQAYGVYAWPSDDPGTIRDVDVLTDLVGP